MPRPIPQDAGQCRGLGGQSWGLVSVLPVPAVGLVGLPSLCKFVFPRGCSKD